MPHEITDRWPVLQAYADALPDLVAPQMENIEVAIDYFEWLQEEARTGRSVEAINEHRKELGQHPLSKTNARTMQERHLQIATERLSELRHGKETIPRIIEGIQINIELLNLKLLNTKPVVAGAAEENSLQLSRVE
jgi:hypothetical protein